MAGTGGALDEPAVVCSPGQAVCLENIPTSCNENGDGYVAGGDACTNDKVCVAGICEMQECAPDVSFCSAGTLRKCADNGLSSEQVEVCGAGKFCDVASASCKTGVCAPDEPTCDGQRATQESAWSTCAPRAHRSARGRTSRLARPMG
jgi:hypothetical protein